MSNIGKIIIIIIITPGCEPIKVTGVTEVVITFQNTVVQFKKLIGIMEVELQKVKPAIELAVDRLSEMFNMMEEEYIDYDFPERKHHYKSYSKMPSYIKKVYRPHMYRCRNNC